MSEPVLRVENLTVTVNGLKLVDDVSFAIGRGEMLGLVGESGCGKTITALAVMQLVPDPPVKIAAGRIVFENTDLLTLKGDALRGVRGDRIGMIFQEPMTSLNPVFTIGSQIAEVLLIHRACRAAQHAGARRSFSTSSASPPPPSSLIVIRISSPAGSASA